MWQRLIYTTRVSPIFYKYCTRNNWYAECKILILYTLFFTGVLNCVARTTVYLLKSPGLDARFFTFFKATVSVEIKYTIPYYTNAESPSFTALLYTRIPGQRSSNFQSDLVSFPALTLSVYLSAVSLTNVQWRSLRLPPYLNFSTGSLKNGQEVQILRSNRKKFSLTLSPMALLSPPPLSDGPRSGWTKKKDDICRATTILMTSARSDQT